MSSAWGDSWGAAWGDSWGARTPAPTGGGVPYYRPTYGGRTQEDREARRLAREALERVPEPVQAVIADVAAEALLADERALREALKAARLEYRETYLEVMQLQAEAREAEARMLAMQDEELGVVMVAAALLLQ